MTNPNPVNSLFDYLDKAVDALENHLNTEVRQPAQKEASNTTGGTYPAEKEASNTTGGSIDEEEGEILNPFIEAQRVLSKVEQVANDLDDNAKAAALIEVAKIHSNIGQQLLEDFIR